MSSYLFVGERPSPKAAARAWECIVTAACAAHQEWRYESGLLTWATQVERRGKLARPVLQALETLESDPAARVRVKQYQMKGLLSCAPYARICVRGELKRLAWAIVKYGDDSRFDVYELRVAEVPEGWVKP